MDYVTDDLNKMLGEISLINFSEDHIKIIMYDLLCCLNFVNSVNLMHRDIKPNNILIDDNCIVTLCDFGLARTIPKHDKPKAGLFT